MEALAEGRYVGSLTGYRIPRCPTCEQPNPQGLAHCPNCGETAPPHTDHQTVEAVVTPEGAEILEAQCG